MIEHLTARLRGALAGAAERDLEEHLAGCAACRAEAEETERLWSEMGRLAEDVPSERMRARFWAALSGYEDARSGGLLGRLRAALERVWPQQAVAQLGLTAASLLVGLLLGARILPGSSAEIRALRSEVRSMNQAVSVSLLEHQSASERLRGVEWSARSEPDERVVSALLETVRHDSNVNVRLAAIDALSPLVQRPRVGRQLLAALEEQDAQIVRISLAELLLRAGVEGSQEAVRRMIEEDQVEPEARDYLQAVMSQHKG